jgi:hypothetical protein
MTNLFANNAVGLRTCAVALFTKRLAARLFSRVTGSAIVAFFSITNAFAQQSVNAPKTTPENNLTPIAFALPDPTTKAVPYSAFVITRGLAQDAKTVASTEPIQACDFINFNPNNAAGVKRVVFATTYSGRNIVLQADKPSVAMPCNSQTAKGTTLSAAAERVWREVVTPARVTTVERPAISRNPLQDPDCNDPGYREPELPFFTAPQARVVAGNRSLFLNWTEGKAPFRVTLTNAETKQVLADVTVPKAREVLLPELNLAPGRYELQVADACKNGIRENNLVAVAKDLPQTPAPLKSARITNDERDLLYVFYLEGLEDGGWTFEALQRAKKLAPRVPAAARWIVGYVGEL